MMTSQIFRIVDLPLVLAIFIGSANASDVSAKTLAAKKALSEKSLREIQKELKEFDHLQVDFVQTRFLSLRSKKRQLTGKAKFSKPDRFRWELQSPLRDQWIFDGKYFYNFNPDMRSAVKFNAHSAKAKELTQVVDLVMNFETLLRRYHLTDASREGDQILVALKPKKTNDINKIELTLSLGANYISNLKLFFTNGNWSDFSFKNPNRNKILQAAYQLPNAVKVTDTN